MQLSFQERTYLVTGGGSGIGKAVAAGLAAAGAAVMIVGRNADRLADAVSEIEATTTNGSAIRFEPTDVTNEDEVTHAVDAATARTQRPEACLREWMVQTVSGHTGESDCDAC